MLFLFFFMFILVSQEKPVLYWLFFMPKKNLKQINKYNIYVIFICIFDKEINQ